MKRLTIRLCDGRARFKPELYGCKSSVICDRLAAIEDILCDGEDEYEQDLNRLRRLVEADRDGRCVVLPCKLHDKIFYIDNGVIRETETESFHNWISGRWKVSAHTDRMYDRWKGYEFGFSDIGEIAFLTRAEAEEALKAKEAET